MSTALPTVGRIVHLYTDDPDKQPNGAASGPYAAIVTQVFGNNAEHNTMANLLVLPPFVAPYFQGSVYEKTQAEQYGMPAVYWVWPPRE